MTQKEFYNFLYMPAFRIQETKGLNALFIVSQAALETGYGKFAIGNNLFGIKAGKNWTGKKKLVTTTEYHDTMSVNYPEVISVTKQDNGKYKYIVKDWFRDYDTIDECLQDHFAFFLNNKRYSAALKFTADPYKFADEIAKAGYATAPAYAATLKSLIKTFEKFKNEKI
jgi:flagellar protein FlgJ